MSDVIGSEGWGDLAGDLAGQTMGPAHPPRSGGQERSHRRRAGQAARCEERASKGQTEEGGP